MGVAEGLVMATGDRCLRVLRLDERGMSSVRWSPDGTRLAFAGGVIGVVTPEGRELWRADGSYVSDVSWLLDGSRLAGASNDGVRVWDAASGQQLCHFDEGDN